MGEVKRVLFLRSNPIDPDPRVEKEAFALAEAGYEVMILGWDRSATLKEFDDVSQVPLRRLRIKADYGTGLQNLPDLLHWEWRSFGWLIRHRNDYDIIHACDFDTVIPALLMKLFWKKRVVYDIFDFYADHLRLTPTWIKNFIRIIDKKCIAWADGIILVDDARREQIKNARPKQCSVIYNTPRDVYHLLSGSEEMIPGRKSFHLAYVGLLQVERGILEMMEIMNRHPDWSLSLAGFGGDENLIREMAAEMENVTWYGRVRYEQALTLSNQADVLFATYDPTILNHRYASPNKVFEAMMLGKPIIVARGTNVDWIIEENQCGLVMDYGDIDGIDEVLTLLSEDEELRDTYGRNARQVYEKKYSWSEMSKRLGELYSIIAA